MRFCDSCGTEVDRTGGTVDSDVVPVLQPPLPPTSPPGLTWLDELPRSTQPSPDPVELLAKPPDEHQKEMEGGGKQKSSEPSNSRTQNSIETARPLVIPAWRLLLASLLCAMGLYFSIRGTGLLLHGIHKAFGGHAVVVVELAATIVAVIMIVTLLRNRGIVWGVVFGSLVLDCFIGILLSAFYPERGFQILFLLAGLGALGVWIVWRSRPRRTRNLEFRHVLFVLMVAIALSPPTSYCIGRMATLFRPGVSYSLSYLFFLLRPRELTALVVPMLILWFLRRLASQAADIARPPPHLRLLLPVSQARAPFRLQIARSPPHSMLQRVLRCWEKLSHLRFEDFRVVPKIAQVEREHFRRTSGRSDLMLRTERAIICTRFP